MSNAYRLCLVCLWLASLMVVGVVAAAQSRMVTPALEPFIASGPDIGFRIDGNAGGVPSGKLVIRVGGRWVEPIWRDEVVKVK